MALPWKLLTRDGHALRAGDNALMGLEVFWGSTRADDYPEHRYADLINPQRPQREFFWTTPDAWGTLSFLDHGAPRSLPIGPPGPRTPSASRSCSTAPRGR